MKDLIDELDSSHVLLQVKICIVLIKISGIIHLTLYYLYHSLSIQAHPLYIYVGDEQDGGDA
ncbi:hypothetical protein GCM10010294_70920 [Streptomyces griseoloalbus]|nr:hypothetical protein GCM10010294_70920 [Streptomyces griseoloalbus]